MKTLLILFMLTGATFADDCQEICKPRGLGGDAMAIATMEAGRLNCVAQCTTAQAIMELVKAIREVKK